MVYAVDQEIVDTNMQALIRSTPADRFPALDRFLERKRDGTFNSSDYVARELLALAFDPARKADAIAIRLDDEAGPG